MFFSVISRTAHSPCHTRAWNLVPGHLVYGTWLPDFRHISTYSPPAPIYQFVKRHHPQSGLFIKPVKIRVGGGGGDLPCPDGTVRRWANTSTGCNEAIPDVTVTRCQWRCRRENLTSRLTAPRRPATVEIGKQSPPIIYIWQVMSELCSSTVYRLQYLDLSMT